MTLTGYESTLHTERQARRRPEFAVKAETPEGNILTLRRKFRSRDAAEDHPVTLSMWRRVWVEELEPKPITPKLRVVVQRKNVNVPIITIYSTVAKHFRLPARAILGSRRTAQIAQVRHIAVYLAVKLSFESTGVIGRAFKRDHSTIMWARDKIAAQRLVDAKLDWELTKLESVLEAKLGAAA